ncbi:hypothetical protein FACS1894164_19830 [Spirochaetia bacterium]|nr:hypothetical protein FACS1894164_19830 [Spirochaetia bacterium]
MQNLRHRSIASDLFFGITLACIVIAFAGPRAGTELVGEYRRGVDVMYAFDLSRSMEVPDVGNSRLERALDIAQEMIAANGGIRMGAAIGKGRGVIAVPLTFDTEALLNFLAVLSTDSITGRGTNLEALVDAACSGFQSLFPTRRVLVLFSDGESLSGNVENAYRNAAHNEILIITVGVGTDSGGIVPGDQVQSRRNSDVLRAGADMTGAIFLDGNAENAAAEAAAYLASLYADTLNIGYRISERPQWRLWVIIALLSFGLTKCMEKKAGTKRKKNPFLSLQ